MAFSVPPRHEPNHPHIEQSKTLSELPEEVISHILHYFDQDPPSISKSNQVPDIRLLHIENAPLKACSSVCRAWRRIVFTPLFRCLRVPLEDVLPQWVYEKDDIEQSGDEEQRLCARGRDWSTSYVPIPDGELWLPKRALDFFDFTAREDLGSLLESLVIYTAEELVVGVNTYPEEGSTRAGHLSRKGNFMKLHTSLAATSLWGELFRHVDPERLVVFAPPVTLGKLIKNCVVNRLDDWHFEIKLQRVELLQEKPHIPGHRSTAEPPARAHSLLQPNRPAWNEAKDMLQQRPWTGFSYHGGSCMKAYGTYHYFDKMPPCILTYNPTFTTHLARHLTHFTYTSVFALNVHFRGIINIITQLDALESLTLQLAPAAGSAALDDLDLISKGHMSLRDCWMEVEKSYEELLNTLFGAEVEPLLPTLLRFTSFDCTREALKDELETLFGRVEPDWKKVGEFTWECRCQCE